MIIRYVNVLTGILHYKLICYKKRHCEQPLRKRSQKGERRSAGDYFYILQIPLLWRGARRAGWLSMAGYSFDSKMNQQ
jgi:hypothetical protein